MFSVGVDSSWREAFVLKLGYVFIDVSAVGLVSAMMSSGLYPSQMEYFSMVAE